MLDPLTRLAAAPRLAVVTDLDGTLTPLRPTPEEVTLSDDIIGLLVALALADGVEVVVASGRPREFLVELFEHAPAVTLSAEHGAWLREDGVWERTIDAEPRELDPLVRALEELSREETWLRIEPKSLCVAVHLRGVPDPHRERAIERTSSLVGSFLDRHPGWVRLDGHEVLEVRPRAASKRLVVDWARSRGSSPILALGDDVTDEDVFCALDADDVGVLVSPDPLRRTCANFRVDEPSAVRPIFAWLLAARSHAARSAPPVLELTARTSLVRPLG
jgi:trehalose-phosphatase